MLNRMVKRSSILSSHEKFSWNVQVSRNPRAGPRMGWVGRPVSHGYRPLFILGIPGKLHSQEHFIRQSGWTKQPRIRWRQVIPIWLINKLMQAKERATKPVQVPASMDYGKQVSKWTDLVLLLQEITDLTDRGNCVILISYLTLSLGFQ